MSREACYAVYDGDTFITLGTAKEVAQELGIKPESVSWLTSPTYKKRVKNSDKRRIVIRVDDDD